MRSRSRHCRLRSPSLNLSHNLRTSASPRSLASRAAEPTIGRMSGKQAKSQGKRRLNGQTLRFGPALMARLDALGAITEIPGQLTRRYLSPAHIESMRQTEAWMVEAGMSVRTDALFSLFGRYEGKTPGVPAIMI